MIKSPTSSGIQVEWRLVHAQKKILGISFFKNKIAVFNISNQFYLWYLHLGYKSEY